MPVSSAGNFSVCWHPGISPGIRTGNPRLRSRSWDNPHRGAVSPLVGPDSAVQTLCAPLPAPSQSAPSKCCYGSQEAAWRTEGGEAYILPGDRSRGILARLRRVLAAFSKCVSSKGTARWGSDRHRVGFAFADTEELARKAWLAHQAYSIEAAPRQWRQEDLVALLARFVRCARGGM
jgi:hypothetical protein